ncbi:hypothetical protein [Salipaludibacillus sp. CF4.18]|uniref:hypothetical protein n=1 Tax=Salipaludibacillus sp. CF4.18 TaxID=3373081 RepID=UPI003EE55921
MEIIFSRSDECLSKVIRQFDKGKWSHVSIRIDDKHILDSRFPRGVQVREFDLEDYEIIRVDGDVELALKHVGKRYDLVNFVWYGFRYGDKAWNNPNEYLCSELVAEAIHDENVKGMTPNEQYNYLK